MPPFLQQGKSASPRRDDLQFHSKCGLSSSNFNRTKYILFYKDGGTITQHTTATFAECKHFLRRKTDLILCELLFSYYFRDILRLCIPCI